MDKDAFARRRTALQTWFIECAILVLASIVALQYLRGTVAPDPSLPSAPGIVSSIALVVGILGLIALLARSRNAVIYRYAGSLPASVVFGFLVVAYLCWLVFSLGDYLTAMGERSLN